MDLLKKSALAILAILMLVGCASKQSSTDSKAEESSEGERMYIQPSLNVPIPDTSSKIVTEPQAFNKDLTAIEITKLMGNGVNLGNTMEAYRTGSTGTKKDPTVYEQLWGQPITSQELMNSYKTAGFDSIRIPVAWTNAMDYEKGDYTINTAYIDRVETIVNYALNAGLYVVFNDHWDGGWWGMFGSATEQTRKDAMELYTKMWTQLAVRFKNYSEKVIFEGANEEVGNRFNDVNVCYDSGTLSQDECYAQAKVLNQAFVDTVRATGGNNTNRFLLIPGYGTDIVQTCDARFIMPTDTAKDKLLLSVHYYTPWGFCGGESVTHWGTKGELAEMNKLLGSLTKFTDKGYGIVIGEYAAGLKKDGTTKPDSIGFFQNFLDNCTVYGYASMLWECSTFYARTDYKFKDPAVADVYSEYSLSKQSLYSDEDLSDAAGERMMERIDAAPELLSDNDFVNQDSKAVAWIMYNSADYSISYSVGDKYNPDSKTDGLVVIDTPITGEGTYTVGLDFTGTSSGKSRSFSFSALAIANGEKLFPGYVIDIKEVRVNDVIYSLVKKPYTTADDGLCTRVNLINEWVTDIPTQKGKCRTPDGNKKGVSAVVVKKGDEALQAMKTLYITFDYGPAKK